MKQCKSCLARAESENGTCPVCGIKQDTPWRDLSSRQRHVRRAARNIRTVAMLHLLGAALGILMLPEFHEPTALLVLTAINAILAIGLIRFAFWAYRLAIAVYFLLGIVFIISVAIPWALVVLLLLYLVGNGTAKAIFERRAHELE